MPLHFILFRAVQDFSACVAFLRNKLFYILVAAAVLLIKQFTSGPVNTWERNLHGRVVIITGGTSGIGAEVAYELAERGAQLILLVRNSSDGWVVEYVEKLRRKSSNQLIYAETCDLESLHSIRKFATRWIDSAPPRRLDMVISCAGVFTPPYRPKACTKDKIEMHWGVNYLANFHLLTLLAPALRAQPADRDVRVIVLTCALYALGDLDMNDPEYIKRGYPSSSSWKSFGASKLALMMFLREYQSRLFDQYPQNEALKKRVRIFCVDPGIARTHMTRRVLSGGSIWGLLIYLIMWPLWWLLLKSSRQGAQTVLHAAMSAGSGNGAGGRYYRDCALAIYRREEILSKEKCGQLWAHTENRIATFEQANFRSKNKTG